MKIDKIRINRFLMEITKSSSDLKKLVMENRLEPESIELKAAKYLLIELAEGVSNILQHILAKEKGIPVSGYIDTIVKGHQFGVISEDLFNRLKPFFDFRNSLVHRYWIIEDKLLIKNLLAGYTDFIQFVDEIEKYLAK
ncbi:MAG: HepT-like ribonuclease domain-containing protein [Candidatus Omnitrophota bacterium]